MPPRLSLAKFYQQVVFLVVTSKHWEQKLPTYRNEAEVYIVSITPVRLQIIDRIVVIVVSLGI